MSRLTIHNLDDALKRRLRIRAAEHGRSMEDEVRAILRETLGQMTPPRDLAATIRARVAAFGGVELKLPPRAPVREPPFFDRAAPLIGQG